MRNQLGEFKERYREALLAFLWRQWSSLGMSGYAEGSDNWMIDPEALLCLTCIIGRMEPRLFDESVDWLRENGSLIHLSRLKAVSALPGLECKRTLSAIALHLENKAGTQKWKTLVLPALESGDGCPFFVTVGKSSIATKMDAYFATQGWLRGPFQFSGKSGPTKGDGKAKLLIRMRSLFGVNARAEIIAYLLSHESAHPHEIARHTHYFAKTVQDAMVQMRNSGLIRTRNEAGKKIYSLEHAAWKPLLFPFDEIPEYLDWPMIFGQMISLWTELNDASTQNASELYQSAKLKTWARISVPQFESAGLRLGFRPEADYPGDRYTAVFLEDMKRFLALLENRQA